MRTVEVPPRVGQREDLCDLARRHAVHRMPTGPTIGELAGRGSRRPAPRAPLIEAEHPAGAPVRLAHTGRVLEQAEQRALDRDVDAGGDRAYQPERCFPAARPARRPAP
jgi:hypothetical protein